MKLYTERYGIRAPKERTYLINNDAYVTLFSCCEKYQKNLTHLFYKTLHDDFTNSDYIVFDEIAFTSRIKITIPTLFTDEYGILCAPEPYDNYDQYALLDFIEFFALNIHDICERWNDTKYKNYKTIDSFETDNVFLAFQKEINDIFTDSGLLYELKNNRTIERIVEYGPLTPEIQKSIETIKETGTKELLQEAVALYKTPNPASHKDAVEKLWDAFERLKTYYTNLDKNKSANKIIKNIANGNESIFAMLDSEFKTLTTIGNTYRIRHHETNKIDIEDERYYDYFFNRCLSLIALAIQYLD